MEDKFARKYSSLPVGLDHFYKRSGMAVWNVALFIELRHG
jgi:hypothetical protein